MDTFEDRFGAFESPAGPCYVEPVGHDVAAGPLDHAGGYRPAVVESGRVVEIAGLLGEVAGGLVGTLAPGAIQAGPGGLAADDPGHLGDFAVEDRERLVAHPGQASANPADVRLYRRVVRRHGPGRESRAQPQPLSADAACSRPARPVSAL